MKRLTLVGVSVALMFVAVWWSPGEPAPKAIDVRTESVNPWTHLDVKADPRDFQFAIVTDRTGGHRAMVFEKAVRALNTLQPEFVISVGDLIEGYTEEPTQSVREWNEFQSFVARLEMPFFFVPGNHDLSNPMMAAEWKRRFGRPFYHFIYRDALFLALTSESKPGDKEPSLGAEQLAYCQKVLRDYPNVRWTFLFLHRPLWSYGPDKLGAGTGWPELELALAGRRFTAFCGHHHRYETWQRNGNRYIQLATTGGSSKMRGKEFGEFDQVAWVSMTKSGPRLTNLLLDGILGFDVKAELAYDQEMSRAQEIQKKERDEARKRRKELEAKRKQKAAESSSPK